MQLLVHTYCALSPLMFFNWDLLLDHVEPWSVLYFSMSLLLCFFASSVYLGRTSLSIRPVLSQTSLFEPQARSILPVTTPDPNGNQASTDGVIYIRAYQFTNEQLLQMKTEVERVMTHNAPYLQHKYSITDLAEETSIMVHHLSAFINNQYKMNFNEFINMHRVAFCKMKLTTEPEWRQLTMEAIAMRSGFGNRNTFTVTFKKLNGITPTEFLKELKAGGS